MTETTTAAESRPTPAPWTEPRCYTGRVEGSIERIVVYGNEGRTVVCSYSPTNRLKDGGDVQEHLANAHLISAAPELLDVLRAYVEIEEEAAPASSSPLRERARAAIRKAEGGAA